MSHWSVPFFFRSCCNGPLPRRAAVLLAMLAALAWSRVAFCDAIHDAAQGGDLATVKALLKANPRLVSDKADKGITPLHLAVLKDHKAVAEWLLAKGANVNAKAENGDTPLHVAALYGNKAMAELLLAKGAKVDVKDNDGATPLHFTGSEKSGKAVAELLLVKGASVNAKNKYGGTPLHEAVANDNAPVTVFLLSKGANVNAKDNSGLTPLQWAMKKGYKAMAKLLRQHGGHA